MSFTTTPVLSQGLDSCSCLLEMSCISDTFCRIFGNESKISQNFDQRFQVVGKRLLENIHPKFQAFSDWWLKLAMSALARNDNHEYFEKNVHMLYGRMEH